MPRTTQKRTSDFMKRRHEIKYPKKNKMKILKKYGEENVSLSLMRLCFLLDILTIDIPVKQEIISASLKGKKQAKHRVFPSLLLSFDNNGNNAFKKTFGLMNHDSNSQFILAEAFHQLLQDKYFAGQAKKCYPLANFFFSNLTLF